MNKRSELIDILGADPYGLLKNTKKPATLSSENQALVSVFEEIQDFVEEFGEEPKSNTSNINEFKLHSRLNAIRSDPRKVKILKNYDFTGLFKGEEIKEITIEDIIGDDPLGLIGEGEKNDIFKLRHVKPADRIQPDYLSRRKVCADFSQFKEMFNTLHNELSCKKRRLIKYMSADLNVGNFYALNGILFYLKSVDGDISKYVYNSGERERFDGRTLCVFDNGTQSDMLFRSLDKAMLIDGYSISGLEHLNKLNEIADDSDVLNGYIYVLKSKNSNVQGINDLYKIGFTTSSVIERIKNAKNEATYLFGEVDIVSTFRCLNVMTYDLEQKIHNFFSPSRLDIELLDTNGTSYKPREWFKVELSLVEDAISLIIKGEIDKYIFDSKINQIIKKNPQVDT